MISNMNISLFNSSLFPDGLYTQSGALVNSSVVNLSLVNSSLDCLEEQVEENMCEMCTNIDYWLEGPVMLGVCVAGILGNNTGW